MVEFAPVDVNRGH